MLPLFDFFLLEDDLSEGSSDLIFFSFDLLYLVVSGGALLRIVNSVGIGLSRLILWEAVRDLITTVAIIAIQSKARINSPYLCDFCILSQKGYPIAR